MPQEWSGNSDPCVTLWEYSWWCAPTCHQVEKHLAIAEGATGLQQRGPSSTGSGIKFPLTGSLCLMMLLHLFWHSHHERELYSSCPMFYYIVCGSKAGVALWRWPLVLSLGSCCVLLWEMVLLAAEQYEDGLVWHSCLYNNCWCLWSHFSSFNIKGEIKGARI